MRRRVLLALVLLATLYCSSPSTGNAQPKYLIRVGAWGNDASKGNNGVRAEIRTHIYYAQYPDEDGFYVVDLLNNGSYLIFGYLLASGVFCLKGAIINGQMSCLGPIETLGADARWRWSYTVDSQHYYFEIGPALSAGDNGTWHRYAISPGSGGGWSFVFDSQEVGNLLYKSTKSAERALVTAEKFTDSVDSGTLGPVEFENLSYLDQNGWLEVSSLTALVDCSLQNGNACDPGVSYGIAVLNANHVAVGSGMTKRGNGDLLWRSNPLDYVERYGYPVAIMVLVIVLVYLSVRRKLITIPERWKLLSNQ